MKVFRVLSTAFVQILLFAKCRNSALSSWHVFTVLLTSQHLEITAVGSVKFPWISQTPSVNFPWNLAHFKKSTVKSRIFSRELRWPLGICST